MYFFPNNEVSFEVVHLILGRLLARYQKTVEYSNNLHLDCVEELRKEGLVTIFNGSPKGIRIHQFSQLCVLSSFSKFMNKFAGKVLIAVQDTVGMRHNFTEEKSKSDLVVVTGAIWRNCEILIPGYSYKFLKIAKFIDDNSTKVYSATRFNFLKNVVEHYLQNNERDTCLDNKSDNKFAFESIASRYLLVELFQYMNYTKGIYKLLQIREQVQHQSFIIKTNRTAMDAISYIILIFFILFYATVTSIFFPQFMNVPLYGIVWLVFVFFYGFWVPCVVILPFAQLESVVQCQKDMRKFLPYLLLIFFLIAYGILWIIVMFMFIKNIDLSKLTTVPVEQKEVAPEKRSTLLCMLAFVFHSILAALCFAHGLRVSFSIIYAHYQHHRGRINWFGRIANTITNCHPELILFLFYLCYSTMACGLSFLSQLYWALNSNSEINKYVVISVVVLIVSGAFAAYNYVMPWLHNKVVKVALWVVRKQEQCVGFFMRFRQSRH